MSNSLHGTLSQENSLERNVWSFDSTHQVWEPFLKFDIQYFETLEQFNQEVIEMDL